MTNFRRFARNDEKYIYFKAMKETAVVNVNDTIDARNEIITEKSFFDNFTTTSRISSSLCFFFW
jgi:hypothetical protein